MGDGVRLEIYPDTITRDGYGPYFVHFRGVSDADMVRVWTDTIEHGGAETVVVPDEEGRYHGVLEIYRPRHGPHEIRADDIPSGASGSAGDVTWPTLTVSMNPGPVRSCMHEGCTHGEISGPPEHNLVWIDSVRVRLALLKVEPGSEDAQSFLQYACPRSTYASYDTDEGQRLGWGVGEVFCGGRSINEEMVSRWLAVIDEKQCAKSDFADSRWARDTCGSLPAVDSGGASAPVAADAGGGESAMQEPPGQNVSVSLPFGLEQYPLVLLAIGAGAAATAAAIVKNRRKRQVGAPQKVPQQVTPRGFQQGLSHNTSKAPVGRQRSNGPEQLYECPQCHIPTNSPDITHHDPDAKHPMGWMECKCGYRHDHAKGQF
ncbi:MAG: hypothetical protein MPK30_02510 [Gammaproteobacteria bacterium]|nr:hypothetical protein [Gammaproteobacteria bacterium]